MQIDMLSVFTDHFAEMKRFYADVLRFEVGTELEKPSSESPKYVEFTGQGVRLALCERGVMVDAVDAERFATPIERGPGGSRPLSFAFRCDDPATLEAEYAALVDRGATAVRAPSRMPWGQYTAFFADPDGHVHELFCDLSEQ